jgi:hypothetical protein
MLRTLYQLRRGIMRKLAGLAGAIALAAAVGACSSSGSSTSATATATPRSGTETITATLTGAPAASYFNSGGITPPSFPAVVFAGVVNTTIRGPVTLGRSTTAKTATHTFVTPAGHLTIRRTEKTRNTQLTPAGRSGSTCYFTASSTGVYTVVGSQSTGKFAGATGGGTYVTTVVVGADLLPGRTTCSVSNAGTVIAKGTSITYRASGSLTVKQ